MTRKTLDLLLASTGLVLTLVLLVGGSLAMASSSFALGSVETQLKQQKIYFPPKGSPALDPKTYPGLQKYAGEQVVDGEMAKAYADEFIGHHLEQAAGGKTYAEVSSASQAQPDNQQLAAQTQTLFRGQTLRGLLLNAYAFWMIGQIALWVAIVCYIGAAILAILTALGFMHARKAARSTEPAGVTG